MNESKSARARTGNARKVAASTVLALLALASLSGATRLEFDSPTYEFREDAGEVFATLRLVDCPARVPRGAVRVEVIAVDGTAHEGLDFYGFAQGTIGTTEHRDDSGGNGGDEAGSLQRSYRTLEVPLRLVHDEEQEPSESFELEVKVADDATIDCGNGAARPTLSRAVVTLVDVPFDQSSVGFGVTELHVTEGDLPGQRQGRFEVVRTSGKGPISVVCQTTRAGSALEREDFDPVAQVLAWGEGDATSRECVVPVLSDDRGESRETVELSLQPLAGDVVVTEGRATLHINDDDSPGRVQFETTRFSASEASGRAVLRLLRRGGSEGEIEVRVIAHGRGATEGLDFLQPRTTLRWPDGEEGSRELELPLLDDSESEGGEQIILSLEMVSPEPLLGDLRNAVVTIDDDDHPGGVGAEPSESGAKRGGHR